MQRQSIRRTLSALLVGLFGLAGAANAVVDFETSPPLLVDDGESFTDNGFTLTQSGSFGVVDSAVSFFGGIAPSGNATQFYGGLNDSSVILARSDNSLFRLSGFDAGFIEPVFQDPGVSAGRIVVVATGALNETIIASFDLGLSGNDGSFAFLTFDHAADFLPFLTLKSAVFFACVYVDASCVHPDQNLAQFALDNINVVAVPEPSTYALLMLGVAALTYRRRQMNKQQVSGE